MAQEPKRGSEGIQATKRVVLPNGVVVLALRNSTAPTVSVGGEIAIGAVHEQAAQNGVAVFTGAALIRGAGERTFQQIVAETEERGASVNAGGGQHGTGFGAKALAEDLPLVLEILADMVMRPTFPQQEVERLRGQFLMSLREADDDPGTRASRAMRARLFPPEHPYSRSSSGTSATVKELSRDDLVKFQKHYHPSLTRIAIVGDIDPEATVTLVAEYFGAWENPAAPLGISFPPVVPPTAPFRQDIAMAGKTQTDLLWAVPGLKRNDPDFYAAAVGNTILGRLGMGGRLSESIREQQGLAYYVSSWLEADRDAGPWVAAAGVNPSEVERALSLLESEIRTFAEEGPSAEELADARDSITGSLVLSLETNDGLASIILMIERYQLGFDYIDRYPTIINSIDAEQIRAVTQRHLLHAGPVIITAGPPLT